jgi:hypothetical protein
MAVRDSGPTTTKIGDTPGDNYPLELTEQQRESLLHHIGENDCRSTAAPEDPARPPRHAVTGDTASLITTARPRADVPPPYRQDVAEADGPAA